MLSGGLGNDKLAGGAGKDVFVFDTKPNKTTNVDHIVDFMPRSTTSISTTPFHEGRQERRAFRRRVFRRNQGERCRGSH